MNIQITLRMPHLPSNEWSGIISMGQLLSGQEAAVLFNHSLKDVKPGQLLRRMSFSYLENRPSRQKKKKMRQILRAKSRKRTPGNEERRLIQNGLSDPSQTSPSRNTGKQKRINIYEKFRCRALGVEKKQTLSFNVLMFIFKINANIILCSFCV